MARVGSLLIEDMQAGLVLKLLSGSTLSTLHLHTLRHPGAYSPAMFGQDLANAIWGDLSKLTASQLALQRGYLAGTRSLVQRWQKSADTEADEAHKHAARGLPPALARLSTETGDDSTYPAWLRGYLPSLKAKLDTASASGNARLHLASMSLQVDKLIKSLQ